MKREFFALLALLFGTIGAQYFYQHRIFAGIVCILLSWTCIPTIIGFVQGLYVLCLSNDEFDTEFKRVE